MSTRNLVPRGNNEGSLGISTQRWSALHVASITTDALKVNDSLPLFTNDVGIASITANNDGQFVIAMTSAFLEDLGFTTDGGINSGFTRNDGNVLTNDDSIEAGDSFKVAIQKLNDDVRQVAVPTTLTVANFSNAAILTGGEAFVNDDNNLMTAAAIDDRIEVKTSGSGLDASGTYTAPTSSNYLASASTLKGADLLLDTQLKSTQDDLDTAEASISTNASNIATNVTNITAANVKVTSNESDIAALQASAINQAEVDAIESGVGLSTAGAHVARSGTNFLDTATSIVGEISLLDAQVKTNESDITSIEAQITSIVSEGDTSEAAIVALQSELDATQTGAGLSGAGSYTAPGVSNYLSGASTLKAADSLLDTQIKTNETAIASKTASSVTTALQSELDATQVGAGLDTDGGYTAISGANFATSSVSIKTAITQLDTQLNTTQSDLDTAEATIVSNTSAISSNDSDIATLQALNNTQEAAIGLSTDGEHVARSGTNFLDSASDIVGEITALDTAVQANVSSLATKATSVQLSALDLRVTSNDSDITSLQTLNNAQEAAIGLSAAGAHVARSGTNYLNSASSIVGEITALDTQVKSNETAIASNDSDISTINSSISAINSNIASNDTEIQALEDLADTHETNIGLDNDGGYTAISGANYATSGVSIKAAIAQLDTQLKTTQDEVDAEETARASGDNTNAAAINTVEASVGLAANGSLSISGTNFLDSSSTIVGALSTLDTNQNLLSGIRTNMIASLGLSTTGEKNNYANTNFISDSEDVIEAIEALDAQLKTTQDEVDAEETARASGDSALQGKIDIVEASVGLSAAGAHVARSGTNFLDSATSIVGEITALDTELDSIDVSNFTESAIDTDLTVASDNDDTIASAKATKSYVDGKLGRFGGIFKTKTMTAAVIDSDGETVISAGAYDVEFDSSPIIRSHFGPFAFDLGQLITDPWPGGSDIIFYGATASGASDRHFEVISTGSALLIGDCLFTGANHLTP